MLFTARILISNVIFLKTSIKSATKEMIEGGFNFIHSLLRCYKISFWIMNWNTSSDMSFFIYSPVPSLAYSVKLVTFYTLRLSRRCEMHSILNGSIIRPHLHLEQNLIDYCMSQTLLLTFCKLISSVTILMKFHVYINFYQYYFLNNLDSNPSYLPKSILFFKPCLSVLST